MDKKIKKTRHWVFDQFMCQNFYGVYMHLGHLSFLTNSLFVLLGANLAHP
jgi:hypothetical protein